MSAPPGQIHGTDMRPLPVRIHVPEYDYIVVGAGSAGCVVATRLSEQPSRRVLLLEAGAAERTRAMSVPSAWPGNLGTTAEWGYVTTPQADAGPVVYPVGRTLGGSGAINAMAHVRGHRAVYDGWAADGASGWGYSDLLPYFRRTEAVSLALGASPVAATLRGTSGPVTVAPVPESARHPVARALASGLQQAGYPATDDLSGDCQEGVAWVDLAIRGGQRAGPADAYLRPVMIRPNLTVETGAEVTRLLVSKDRCTGVRYQRDGETGVAATASAEVILCAGAVGSPRLLMLSGIGPAGQLRKLGIDPVADLPGVGENLQDHPVTLLYYTSGAVGSSCYNHGELYSALRSPLAGACPDLQVFPILLPLAPPGEQPPRTGFALASAVIAPDSRGTVRLAAADPRARPLIDPALLACDADAERAVAGLCLIRDIAAGPAFEGVRGTELWPGEAVRGREGLRAHARRVVSSYYHPAGTCRMGIDALAVTGPELRVHGVSRLRVADASVMPAIPNAHPHATVLAIAEKAADLVRASQSGSALPVTPALPVRPALPGDAVPPATMS
jgi:choline dehydrogenase